MRRQEKRICACRHRGISMTWKLGAYLTVFVAFVILITWVFQVLLLNTFYQSVKRTELEEAAQDISCHLGDEEEALESLAYSYAVDCSMCVNIYRIEGSRARLVVNESAPGAAFTAFLSPKKLSEFYTLALENEGFYQEIVSFRDFGIAWSDRDRPQEELSEDGGDYLVNILLSRTSDGETYMIFLNAGLVPMSSTVDTLRMQFVWIAAILFVAAAVMSYLLSRGISKPLVRMNESAKRLALGKYDAEFQGYGYRETRELANTLNYASSELSKLDALQKELIANISHDLRTPLTMIRGYSEVIRDIPEENTPENLQVIIDETARLSELVNDLLDLSRIQAGTRKPAPEIFDLDATVGEVLTRYEAFVKHRGYTIRFSPIGETLVSADRGMLLQVLYNLINNAINYTGEDNLVTVELRRRGDRVRFSVTDTGAGIAEEDLPSIWNRYYRVDRVHRRAVIGTGLGLSIVKEVLEAHGAVYGVQSRIGEGSTFWFELNVIAIGLSEPGTTEERQLE